MKSRIWLGILFGTSGLITLFLLLQTSSLDTSLPLEILPPGDARSDPGQSRILPYGHTLGPWPTHFRGEPVVSRLTYLKGPPKKFLETFSLIWAPVDAEISISGPKTPLPDFKRADWRECFQKNFLCSNPKKTFWSKVFPDREMHRKSEVRATWFESGSADGPRGVHLLIRSKSDSGREQIEDRFAILTPGGTLQTLSIRVSNNPVGSEARGIFMQTIGSLKVHEDLTFGRAWIAGDLKDVDLRAQKTIPEPKTRLLRLIEVQNLIFAHMSVDPSTVDSFYHLAGVTHRLALDLLRTRDQWFKNQESWLNEFPSLLATLAKYSRDFPESNQVSERIEALLQDFLLEQSRLSRR